MGSTSIGVEYICAFDFSRLFLGKLDHH